MTERVVAQGHNCGRERLLIRQSDGSWLPSLTYTQGLATDSCAECNAWLHDPASRVVPEDTEGGAS